MTATRRSRVTAAEIIESAKNHLDWCIVCDPDDERQAWIHEMYGLSIEG